MKKLFLIPLMTLVTCVMAWADPVTTLADLQTALNAGGEVTLGADINAGSTELVSSATTVLDLNSFTLSGSKNNAAGGVIKVNGGSLTINATNGGAISAANQLNAIYVSAGVLTINAGEFNGSYEAIMGVGGTINIDGGTFTSSYDNAVWAKGATLNITGGNFDGSWYDVQSDAGSVTRISGGVFAGDNDGTLAVGCYSPGPDLVVSGGTFNGTGGIGIWNGAAPVLRGGDFVSDPSEFVNLSERIVTKSDGKYHVIAVPSDCVAYSNYVAHTSLSAAIDASPAGQHIYMYKSDLTATAVSKCVTVETNGLSCNLSAGSGFSRADQGNNIIFTDNALAAFLMTDGTASYSIDSDIDISNAGAIHVSGTKTLTVEAGVKVLYLRQGSLANIVVDEGAKLTILGSGTFQPVIGTDIETSATAADHMGNRIIDVDGELEVGVKDNANNQPHFITTSIARGAAINVNEGGTAVFNNADMDVANISIWNNGNVTIHGGEYVSCSTYNNGVNNGWRAYHLKNAQGGYMAIYGGHIVGVQGAFTCETSATADIYGGVFETRTGRNFVTGEPNAKDNHYALYVTEYGVVNIYDGYFKVQIPSAGGNEVALIGDNDSRTTFGVINLYGGNFAKKPKLTHKKAQDADMTFPASIPSTSQWYSSFGLEVPLPAGYEYYETGDATYPYGVRPIDGKEVDAIDPAQQAAQEADPTYTIPWQQATTWATDEVPATNTIVTIPVDATVTVSKDEATKEAVADQVYVNQGATLVVEEGTVLNVGDGGVNVANGGQIVVEPGAVVTVGSAGLVTTEDEALVIEATEEDQGVFLLKPEVTENTQPKATVKLVTKCKQVGANEFIWERFAIPTLDGSATTYSNEGLDSVHYYGGATTLQEGLYEWDGNNWAGVNSWKNLQPFKGYQLTNNSMYGNVVYTFEGNLVGNSNMDYHFTESGFGFFGNSYTGDIDIMKFFESFGEDMQKTIWIYDYYTDQFKAITETSYGTVYYGKRNDRHGSIQDIRSMQAFLMNTFATGSSTQNVDYSAAIWGNPKYGLVPNPNPAPAHAHVGPSVDMFTVYVVGEKQDDEVRFIRGNEYSAAFDNGADASKWMNNGMNLYVTTEIGDMSAVASDEIVNMTITFQSGNETEYTLGFDNISGEQYELRDVLTGATIQMTESATYSFSQEANTTIPARFQVVAARKVPTGIEDVNAPVMQKVMKDGNLYILRDNQWYNAQGQIIK